MFERKTIWLSAVLILTLLLSACGSSASNESVIATSVALTVAAQNASAPAATPVPVTTSTPSSAITPVPTLTNIAPAASPTTTKPAGNSYLDCTKASLVGEDTPDGTIFGPSANFTKTWQIKNESNCTWSTSYRIVYFDGDMLGGSYYYNLPQTVAPGQVVNIALQLVSPAADGSYKSEWKLQTPDGYNFGVGQYSEPFFTNIVVSSSATPDYKVTSVTFRYERDPLAGCATNVRYTIYATITVNGPIDIAVKWVHSDGPAMSKIKLSFSAAGTQEIQDTWSIHLGSTPGDRTDKLLQVDPVQVDWGGVTFSYLCGS